MLLLAVFLLEQCLVEGLAPKFSWDTVGDMTFFHSCNESGLFSEDALNTITRFPFVTIEKGQGFNDSTGRYAEEKIAEQIQAVKKRDPSICCIYYMNSVLDWYFYHMSVEFQQQPTWWLRDSKNHQPVKVGGDPTFNPPKDGMLVFDHAVVDVQQWWQDACYAAVSAGADGCFSDSSEPGSHGTSKFLNNSDNAAFEKGKVQTMTEITAHFGGQAGQPYKGNGVLIGKTPSQEGINALQIEFFLADENSIQNLMAGVKKGYLVQAHVSVHDPASTEGCRAMNDTLAAFLIGAGELSYYGTGAWIAANLQDVEQRWCPPLFERSLGPPLGPAVKGGDGVYRRSFQSGTNVTFNTHTNRGNIVWGK